MCKERNSVEIPYKNALGYKAKVDSCMANFINKLNGKRIGIKTIACCCGHLKYKPTIVCKDKKKIHVLVYSKDLSRPIVDIIIPRTRNFYKTDKPGYYYIPEVIAHDKKN